jgi:hypothetical protein
MRKFLISALLVLPFFANAENCSSILELAKIKNTRSEAATDFQNHASNFCKTYQSETSRTTNTSFGASYKFLAASMNKGSASYDEVASTYCSSTSSESAKTSAFQSYIESIDSAAFASYDQCIRIQAEGLIIEPNSATVTKLDLMGMAGFTAKAGRGARAELKVKGNLDINCKWDRNGKMDIELSNPSTETFSCTRNKTDEPGTVTVTRLDAVQNNVLNIKWPDFDKNGNSIESLTSLRDRVKRLESQVDAKRVDRGVLAMTADATSLPINDNSNCTGGANTFKGTRNGRYQFLKEFTVAPRVTIGLSVLELPGGVTSPSTVIDVGILSVDTKGFNYKFTALCQTIVNSAAANWMAVSE